MRSCTCDVRMCERDSPHLLEGCRSPCPESLAVRIRLQLHATCEMMRSRAHTVDQLASQTETACAPAFTHSRCLTARMSVMQRCCTSEKPSQPLHQLNHLVDIAASIKLLLASRHIYAPVLGSVAPPVAVVAAVAVDGFVGCWTAGPPGSFS